MAVTGELFSREVIETFGLDVKSCSFRGQCTNFKADTSYLHGWAAGLIFGLLQSLTLVRTSLPRSELRIQLN